MQSKTRLLLEREHICLQEARFFGISACPVKEDLLEWVATLQGLKDSLWEGAALQLSLKYTEDYNSVPPTVTFNTIPFHPNVDAITGKPCIDFLDNPRKWEEHFSMTTILLAIQVEDNEANLVVFSPGFRGDVVQPNTGKSGQCGGCQDVKGESTTISRNGFQMCHSQQAAQSKTTNLLLALWASPRKRLLEI
ncbi:ubiquitin-conjugating enzyme E2 U-like isoform X2 [Narcine bancroftii]|uniref:ubiquitin-conjugating enzyme E2 U-like isoform X2 n=1 Tax=Narcine bancroftii TaxID=1343680 RepID=UPI003831BF27